MQAAALDPARIRPALTAAGGVLVALVVAEVSGLATLPSLLLALVAAAAAAYAFGASPPPAAAAAPAVDDTHWRSLRHDLRGILSPAMLMADRLLMVTEDPLAKRTAGAMIEAIERAETRMKGDEKARGSAPGPR